MSDTRTFHHKGATRKESQGHPYNYPKGQGQFETRYSTSKAVADAMNARFPTPQCRD